MTKCSAGYSCPLNTGYQINILIMELKDFTNLLINIYDADNKYN
jgi:hypothetical protein